jgi:branched-chain amino acid transport system ATP-binding protein
MRMIFNLITQEQICGKVQYLDNILEARNLTKDFGGLVAVKDVSFNVHSGEIIGLIGPNGAGKTTVFNLITGIERIQSGEVFFEGINISKLKPHEICKLGISRTYQSVRPFLNHTVRENVSVGAIYGRNSDGLDWNKRVDQVLDLLELHRKENLLARNLPIEERKMVEVGRALAADPKILMLDEPMAGLNATEISKFVELMKKLNVEEKLTIVIVEHVMKAISSACSRVVVMHHGEILAEGSPENVLSDERVIEVYLGESYTRKNQGIDEKSENGNTPA